MYLKGVELTKETLSGFTAFVSGNWSLLNCYKFPEVSEYLSLYSIKLYIDKLHISRLLAPSTCSSFIWVMHLVYGAQFLNTTLVLALPPVAVMSAVTRIYESG